MSTEEVEEVEVVEAELVDDERLPALATPTALARPVLDRHTILRPGELPALQRPQYTARDFSVSEETARRMADASAPKNTDRNYRSQRGMFERWCAEMGRVAQPCTTATYVEYIASLIARGYAPNTIRTHKSAIRSWQPEDAKPGTAVINGMIREYAKEWGKRNRVKKAPAITDPMFRAMVATCDPRHPIGIRDRAALVLGRGALNRRIELADLVLADVDVDDDFVSLHIRFSKTHQDGDTEPTDIPAEPTDLLICPVDATRAWFTMLHRLGVRDGAFFRALTVAGTLQNRSTAKTRGDHVSGDAVNDWVRARAFAAKLTNWQDITAHGLRRGGAQAIADAGGDPTAQGRWQPGSSVVKKEYLDRAQSRAENPWLKVQEKRRPKESGA
ncbi:tyrosine-type recombinase/integrase [Streptomyces sp. LBUM 1483]|uniref:integrase n=1 Tax=Streptomyces scabiei TaxID=1930 RepID=UPI001B31E353|nr:integrase [Streptomyces sp. LBUM 1483]MBP5926664.1 tyrosine-type recombinase/integrase [Streptomyces sp. LBUM 1483]